MEQRNEVAATGAVIEHVNDIEMLVGTIDAEEQALRDAGFDLQDAESPAAAANARIASVQAERAARGEVVATAGDFPSGDEAYHTYDETNAKLRAVNEQYPDITEIFDIGKSVEGRTIYGLKISDNVSQDENEPESIQTCNIHAREHLTTEMCIYMIDELTQKYATEDRIKNIVDNQVMWIIPMANPDGSMYDISGGRYHSWRKNRTPGRRATGVDLNRNFAHDWGCCNGSSGDENSDTYRGAAAESGIEVKNLSDWVRERNKDKRRIETHIDWHTYSELILWPFGKTSKQVVPGMTQEEYEVFETLGTKLAESNNYQPMQSSGLYVTDGSSGDWFWGDQKIWSFTYEMYPGRGDRRTGFYPPGSLIPRETERNRESFLTFLEHTDCVWRAVGKEAEKCQKRDDPTPAPEEPAPTPEPEPAPEPEPTPAPGDMKNDTDYAINDYETVTSQVTSSTASASTARVTLDVGHTCKQNLRINLVDPSGQKHLLKRSKYAFSCTDWNGSETIEVPVSGTASGTWGLEVSDWYSGNTGTLRGWELGLS